ncbi:MAG: hypothetical protein IKG55_07040, partial [Solobacterium sp.]|nr:hypothetical protein [Solobacterium sp.]
MDDNELDKLFGMDGGDEGSGADDSEHLQIVDSKEEKASEAEKSADSGEEKDSGEETESVEESSDGVEEESEASEENANFAK